MVLKTYPNFYEITIVNLFDIYSCQSDRLYFRCTTRRHGNFARVHKLLRILLPSNSAVLINIITGVSPQHFHFVVFILCSVSMLRNFLTTRHEYNNIPFWISTTNVFPKSRILKFLKRDCGTIPVAEIISGKIEIFSKHQRLIIATESSKFLLIFVLSVCVILCAFGTAISKRICLLLLFI
jgi:hypothetical protein